MRIKVKTDVHASLERVRAGFTKDLFLLLNPPFPSVKIRRFDGCKRGDRVNLELNFLFFKQAWESLITENIDTEREFSFLDEGVALPFFLKSWKHHHLVIRDNGKTWIIDDIHFSTPFVVTNYLLYPILYLQFLYRKPVYRKFFNS